MAGDALARVAAVEGVVTQFVTVAMASRARALGGENLHSKPVFNHQDELSWWDAKAKGGDGWAVQPVTRVRECEAFEPGNLPFVT